MVWYTNSKTVDGIGRQTHLSADRVDRSADEQMASRLSQVSILRRKFVLKAMQTIECSLTLVDW